jgi:hypothetical protein
MRFHHSLRDTHVLVLCSMRFTLQERVGYGKAALCVLRIDESVRTADRCVLESVSASSSRYTSCGQHTSLTRNVTSSAGSSILQPSSTLRINPKRVKRAPGVFHNQFVLSAFCLRSETRIHRCADMTLNGLCAAGQTLAELSRVPPYGIPAYGPYGAFLAPFDVYLLVQVLHSYSNTCRDTHVLMPSMHTEQSCLCPKIRASAHTHTHTHTCTQCMHVEMNLRQGDCCS